jgi:hypothetical protein
MDLSGASPPDQAAATLPRSPMRRWVVDEPEEAELEDAEAELEDAEAELEDAEAAVEEPGVEEAPDELDAEAVRTSRQGGQRRRSSPRTTEGIELRRRGQYRPSSRSRGRCRSGARTWTGAR